MRRAAPRRCDVAARCTAVATARFGPR